MIQNYSIKKINERLVNLKLTVARKTIYISESLARELVKSIEMPFKIINIIDKKMMDNYKQDLVEQLTHQTIRIDKIEELKRIIVKNLHKSLIDPGEPVGILTAQSIGEKQTQMTLNTFHQGLFIFSLRCKQVN